MNFTEEICNLNKLAMRALASKPHGYDDQSIADDAIQTIEFLKRRAFSLYVADVNNVNKYNITYSMIKDYIVQ